MKKPLYLVLTSVLAFVLASCVVYVTKPASHPAYLHALSDLRMARAFLDKLTDSDVVDQKEADAIAQINSAIGDINEAAIDDGKNLSDHPPIDANISRQDRFGKAVELLKSARRDVNKAEYNGPANNLKNRAIGHINNALRIIADHYRVLYQGSEIDIKF